MLFSRCIYPLSCCCKLFLLLGMLLKESDSFGQTRKGSIPKDGREPVSYIDPTIGNVAPLLNTNRPVVHRPNQMIRVFPHRQDHLDMQITDFPLTALNIITPQVIFGIKPSIGPVTDTGWYRRLTYDHDFETTQPWYYAVELTDDLILTEFTAGDKTGIYRFSFPAGVKKNLLLSHYYKGGEYQISRNRIITGKELVDDAIHQQRGMAYMYGEVTGQPESGIREGEKDWGKYTVNGTPEKARKMDGQRAFFSYPDKASSVIEFRYAISFISAEQARTNFQHELRKITFEQLKAQGKKMWEKTINQIRVEGGTEAQKRSFYTALYRCYARMVDITENGRYFSAWDNQVHADSIHFYTDDYSWGNYLALHPLRSILDPQKEGDMLQSYVRAYEQSGWMPEYPKFYGDRAGMFAFHSSIMFLDAYRKGIRNFNAPKALDGMIKNEEQATLLPSRNGPRGALEDFYDRTGYYPALRAGETETDSMVLAKPGQKRSSVAVTLGDSYDSWAVSKLATALSRNSDAQKFAARAGNYRNLWSEKDNLFMPKDAAGHWISIDPKFDGGTAGLDYYNENNGWCYRWNVQHDIPGLIALMGGPDKFEQTLDQHFREGLDRSRISFLSRFPDQTSLIGQFSMGNQINFFIPYLFNFTSSPWKTQKYTRLLLDTWFQDNIFGVPGDEDGGSMSAFVVFSAMGFYPVTPGLPEYAITSPQFSRISIGLPNGKRFRIIAENNSRQNKYLQSATLNGKLLRRLFFSHDDLVNGGVLVLKMGRQIPGKVDHGQPVSPK